MKIDVTPYVIMVGHLILSVSTTLYNQSNNFSTDKQSVNRNYTISTETIKWFKKKKNISINPSIK